MHKLVSFPSWTQYFRFCLVGAGGLLVDMVIFHLLYTRGCWPMEISKLVAAESALLNNFLWNDRWTFGSHRIEENAPRLRRLIRFHVVCLSGIVLAMVILGVMHRWGELQAEIANGVAIVAVSGWNFGWSRLWGWGAGRIRSPGTGMPRD